MLLAEDQLTTARVVRSMLTIECKAVVDTVDNGTEAVELARHYDYDAIILDLALPNMRGIEVMRQLCAAGRDTPVLVLSDLAAPETKIQAFKAGADDVISKPVDTDELCARVKAIVRRNKGHSQSCL